MDGLDYHVFFMFEGEKVRIDSIKAFTDRKALNLAEKIYGKSVVTVARVK